MVLSILLLAVRDIYHYTRFKSLYRNQETLLLVSKLVFAGFVLLLLNRFPYKLRATLFLLYVRQFSCCIFNIFFVARSLNSSRST